MNSYDPYWRAQAAGGRAGEQRECKLQNYKKYKARPLAFACAPLALDECARECGLLQLTAPLLVLVLRRRPGSAARPVPAAYSWACLPVKCAPVAALAAAPGPLRRVPVPMRALRTPGVVPLA